MGNCIQKSRKFYGFSHFVSEKKNSFFSDYFGFRRGLPCFGVLEIYGARVDDSKRNMRLGKEVSVYCTEMKGKPLIRLKNSMKM